MPTTPAYTIPAKVRTSVQYPSISVEFRPYNRGPLVGRGVYLEFRIGSMFEGFQVTAEGVTYVACNDRGGVMSAQATAYCKAFAQKIADRLARADELAGRVSA